MAISYNNLWKILIDKERIKVLYAARQRLVREQWQK